MKIEDIESVTYANVDNSAVSVVHAGATAFVPDTGHDDEGNHVGNRDWITVGEWLKLDGKSIAAFVPSDTPPE